MFILLGLGCVTVGVDSVEESSDAVYLVLGWMVAREVEDLVSVCVLPVDFRFQMTVRSAFEECIQERQLVIVLFFYGESYAISGIVEGVKEFFDFGGFYCGDDVVDISIPKVYVSVISDCFVL